MFLFSSQTGEMGPVKEIHKPQCEKIMMFGGCVDLVRGQGLCLGPMGSFPKNRQEEPWHVDFILNTIPFCFTLNMGVNDCEDLFCHLDTT